MKKAYALSLISAVVLSACTGASSANISATAPQITINRPKLNLNADFALGDELYKSADLSKADGARVYASSNRDLSFPKGWALGLSGVGLVAAVIDSGVDFNIAPDMSGYYRYAKPGNWPDVQNRLDLSTLRHFEYTMPLIKDPQCNEGLSLCTHGNKVAALINSLLPEAKFANITSVNANATGDKLDIGASVDAFSLKGVRFFNRSFGDAQKASASNPGDYLVAIANKNALVVSAAGNEETNGQISTNALEPNSPLRKGWIIALGYGDYKGIINSVPQSNEFYVKLKDGSVHYVYPRGNTCKRYGEQDCIGAPYTFYLNDEHINSGEETRVDGTSFSTPAVLASAMAVYAKYPWMSNDNIKQTLFSTAYKVYGASEERTRRYFGVGILNAADAMHGPAGFEHTFNANVSDGIYVFSNDIKGSFGLNKSGPGTLALSGHNSFLGDINNTEGGLWLSSSNLASVNNYALLRLSHATLNELNNHKILISEGFSANNLNLFKNSQTYINIGDKITVKNKAVLDGELNVVGVKSGYLLRKGEHNERVLDAASVQGRFKAVNSLSAFLKVDDALYDQSGLSLKISADNKLANMPEINEYAARNYESLFDRFDYLAAAKEQTNDQIIRLSPDQMRGEQYDFAAFLQQLSPTQALNAADYLFGNQATNLAASNLAAAQAIFNSFESGYKDLFAASLLQTKAAGQKQDLALSKISLNYEKDDFLVALGAAYARDNQNSSFNGFSLHFDKALSAFKIGADLMYLKQASSLDTKSLAASLSVSYLAKLNQNFTAKLIANARIIHLKNDEITLGLAHIYANSHNLSSQSIKGVLSYENDSLVAEVMAGLRLNQGVKYSYDGEVYGARIINQGELLNNHNFLVGANLNMDLSKNMTLNLAHSLEFAKGYYINQLSLGFNYKF